MFLYPLSSPTSSPIAVAGAACPSAGCSSCGRCHVTASISWVATARPNLLLIGTDDDDVYAADSSGCNAQLLARFSLPVAL